MMRLALEHHWALRAFLLLALVLLLWMLSPPVAGAAEEKNRAQTKAALQELDVTLREMGREAYYQFCAACHGLAARGHGLVAKALDPPPPDLTRMAERRGGEVKRAELVEIIDGRKELAAHGSRDMPVWGRRFGAEVTEDARRKRVALGRIRVIVHYLLSIQEPEEPAEHD
jgi:mono/diheme cytochrome c family protein